MGRAAKIEEVQGLMHRKENVAKIIAWGGGERVIICRDKNPHCGHISYQGTHYYASDTHQ